MNVDPQFIANMMTDDPEVFKKTGLESDDKLLGKGSEPEMARGSERTTKESVDPQLIAEMLTDDPNEVHETKTDIIQ